MHTTAVAACNEDTNEDDYKKNMVSENVIKTFIPLDSVGL